jgi:translation elongation factor EF-G
MEQQKGIWIDHRKALIVDLNGTEKLRTIYSELDDDSTRIDSPSKFGDQAIRHEKKLQAKKEKVLKSFYDDILESIENKDDLYVFGPASAKKELKKAIEDSSKNPSAIKLETADSMTDNQVVARVSEYFRKK